MLKPLTVCAVLHILFFTGSEAKYNVTKLELDNSYTLAIVEEFITVWLSRADGSLHTNSSNKFSMSCNFSYNGTLQRMSNGIQAEMFMGGAKIVVWGIGQQLLYKMANTSERRYIKEYELLLVNPWACEYKRLNLPIYKTQKSVPLPYGDIIVVTYLDSFDVFLPGQRNCSPCRYDMEGKKVDLEYQLEFSSPDLAPYVTPKGIHIQPFHPGDPKQGYFFARNFENNTAVIEQLDEHFKTLNRLYVDHPVHSVSMKKTIMHDHRISICYASHNFYPVLSPHHLEVHCRHFDTNFQPKLSIRIPVNENNFVFGILDLTHVIDSLGNTYVGLIESSNRRMRTHDSSDKSSPRDDDYNDDVESRQFRYFVYDKSGKLLESHDLEKVDRIVNPRNRSNGLYSLLLMGNKVCMNNQDFISNNVYEIKSYATNRCFDISNYRPTK